MEDPGKRSVACVFGPHEAAAACVLASRSEPGQSLLAPLALSLLALAFAAVMFRYGELPLAAVAAVLVAAAWHNFAVRRVVAYQAWFQRRAWRQAGLPATRRMTVTLTADWINAASRDNRFALRWRAVRQVLQGDGVIVITQTPRSPWLVIPDASFPTGEARADFLEFIEERRRTARNAGERSAAAVRSDPAPSSG